jgi:N-acetylmuramoyl-L-alanine amidase
MRYVTIHNTGNSNMGANAKNHASYVKSNGAANIPVSWHYTVDESGAYPYALTYPKFIN